VKIDIYSSDDFGLVIQYIELLKSKLRSKYDYFKDEKFNVAYYLDFKDTYAGFFEYETINVKDDTFDSKDSIFVNLLNCDNVISGKKLVGTPFSSSYIHVIIHEYLHYIVKKFKDNKFNVLTHYKAAKRNFSIKTLYLNEYSKTNLEEEFVENATLMLINPILLYSIDRDRFFYFRELLNFGREITEDDKTSFFYFYKTYWTKDTLTKLNGYFFDYIEFSGYSKTKKFDNMLKVKLNSELQEPIKK